MRDLMERIAAAHLSEMSLPPEMLNQLAQLHIRAQDAAYGAGFPDAEIYVVRHDGRPVGRYVLAQLPGRLHVVDLALLPDVRGQGIGTDVLMATVASARRLGVDSVTLRVAVANRAAQRLYQRLGFRFDARDDGTSATLAMTMRLDAADSMAAS
jgi:ribosomal protein S18 acetylase RimI-like enzyme